MPAMGELGGVVETVGAVEARGFELGLAVLGRLGRHIGHCRPLTLILAQLGADRGPPSHSQIPADDGDCYWVGAGQAQSAVALCSTVCPWGGELARVFVSHASEDQLVAARLHRWLVDDGHEVFLDRDLRDGIAVGEEWEQRLHERLRWADAVVCVVTSASVASPWCTAEVGIARSRGSRLLPVLAEPGMVHPLLGSASSTPT